MNVQEKLESLFPHRDEHRRRVGLRVAGTVTPIRPPACKTCGTALELMPFGGDNDYAEVFGECLDCVRGLCWLQSPFATRADVERWEQKNECTCGPEGCDCEDYKESYYAQYS